MNHSVFWPEEKVPVQGTVLNVDLPGKGLTEVVVTGYSAAGIVVNDAKSLVSAARLQLPVKGK